MNGRPRGAQEQTEQRSQSHHSRVVPVGGDRRQQRQHTGPQHAVAEHTTAANQLGQSATRQFGQQVAPEKASVDHVLLEAVPLEVASARRGRIDLRNRETKGNKLNNK